MEWMMYVAFFAIAFLYGSVGHGGASGYIALMTLFAFPTETTKTNALILNILVSGIAFINFYNVKSFPKKLFLLLALCSIPMAFWGGTMTLQDRIYKILLGIILLIPVVKFFGLFPNKNFEIPQKNYLVILIGLSIGLLSGMLGIGGGIILSPIIILFGWCDVKQAASISALFIFVNSIAGLIGKSTVALNYSSNIGYLIIFTVLGGFSGAYLGSKKFSIVAIKRILAVVLLVASIKLFFT